MKKVKIDRLYGNESIKKYIEDRISNGDLFHAVILSGKEGSGKSTLAKQMTSAIACRSLNAPCGQCDACKKILNDECVDVHTIKLPEGRSFVPIDSIRAIYDTIAYKPNDLDFKVYLIQKGDKMLPLAQNALLKLLEEPPENVYFFILCEDEKKLLPTIRSRCEVFRLQEFSAEELERYLRDNFEYGDHKTASSLAQGSLGLAVKMLNGDDPAIKRRQISDRLVELLLDRSVSEFEFISFQHENIKSLQELFEIYRLLLSALRDILAAKESDFTELLYYENTEKLDDHANRYSSYTLASMCKVLLDVLSNETVNTRLPLTITSASSMLWDMKFNGEK